MSKTVFIAALVLVMLAACGPQNERAAKLQEEAAAGCRSHGGTPIADKWGMYLRCEMFQVVPKKDTK